MGYSKHPACRGVNNKEHFRNLVMNITRETSNELDKGLVFSRDEALDVVVLDVSAAKSRIVKAKNEALKLKKKLDQAIQIRNKIVEISD